MSSKDVRVVLCTCLSEAAPRIARTVMEDGLVARVDVVANVTGFGAWRRTGRAHVPVSVSPPAPSESLLVLRTRNDQRANLERRLLELEPATPPEVLSVDGTHAPYINWLGDPSPC